MTAPPHVAPAARLPLALRFALRELRGARRGFFVFLACLTLGVMSIAGVGSFARALTEGLAREGRTILGGDAAFTLIQREASPEELALLAAGGPVSRVASLRAMARAETGEATLVELKAVDGAYPLVGTLETRPAEPVADLLAARDGAFGALADATLLGRLGVKVGDRVAVGAATLVIRGEVTAEPDRLSAGVGFGPRLMIGQDALAATELIQPGSLVRWIYRVRLDDGADPALAAFVERVRAGAPEAGFEVRTRDAASPQLERNVGRIAQYLTLVGLTALLVGGVGVANAVASHLSAKRETIATLKALGATRGAVFGTYLTQVGLLAAIGIALGLVLGAALPFVATFAAAQMIPFPLAPEVSPAALALAALYGALVTLAFTLWPLARAQEAPVSALFRDALGEERRRPPLIYAVLCGLAIAALVGVAALTAEDLRAALIFLAAAAGVFVLLRGVALLLMAVARRLPRPRSTMARLALANIHRPGALTPTVVLSLGLGLSLLTAIALIDRSLTDEISGSLAERAPSFFFVDVPGAQEAEFRDFLAARAPGAAYKSVPMLRGRIVALGGVPAEQVKPSADAAWVLQSDRGISFSDAVPEGSKLVAGEWWGPQETEALVSFEQKLAEGLGLAIGDRVTVNVLGREITARIANLREVEWQRLGINFVMVFSPATFAGAPHTVLATLTAPDGAGADDEVALLRELARAYPAITTVRVKEALEQANKIVADLSLGIRIASLVTLLTSVLVLAGALAAGHQHRVYDAVVLKTLGATRARLIGAYGLEYAGLGLATAVFAVGAGTLSAYLVVTRVMEIGFAFSPAAALGAVGIALAFTLGFGLLGTWRALSAPPVRVLRHL
ncbi:ABC transporter permease [Aquabacter spiritensis]|uniref:Putative ABC transport system permease protein n=1 Tax=Aquabacter spiritensis TaxID=933073 RepID=A0A4R3M6Y7_9HYPH|nr:FtsX-like permease family protein [Aquabacter spiritensis]TCT08029.1 putative ABC transport system permease protein [Aquabacter spiritensis]